MRIGTVYEESRIPLKHWAYAFWRASTSKKGISALEIQRHCQISYKSALFLLHRMRFALSADAPSAEKLGGNGGTVEYDETFVGGKVRPNNLASGNYKPTTGYRSGSNKIPVLAMVERGGTVRTKVVPALTHKNLGAFIDETIDKSATVNTDGYSIYPVLFRHFKRHDVVNHSIKEYARHNAEGTVSHTNTAESFFSLIKRGLHGIYHAVSREHLHRYLGEFEFRWNNRNLCDGDRITAAIQGAEGKRLVYSDSVKK